MESELKPCGCGDSKLEVMADVYDGTYQVECCSCGKVGPQEISMERAIAAWNRRVEKGDQNEH